MSFKSLDIKPSYESGVGDIVQDFYEPVLTESVLYDRISGFFTSTSLAVAARGMCNFIKNGGIMRIITSPILSSDDVEVVEQLIEKKGKIESKELGLDLAENEIEEMIKSVNPKEPDCISFEEFFRVMAKMEI